MDKFRIFTHNSFEDDDWSTLYPYTIVGYQYGKRVYREFSDAKLVVEAIEEAADCGLWSTALIIAPNGQVWKPRDFEEQYNIAIGLIVPEPTKQLPA